MMIARENAIGSGKKMKLVEKKRRKPVYVDDFGEHQVINGVLHTVGYRMERNESGEEVGVIEVRLIINLANFRDACIRGIEMTSAIGGSAGVVSEAHH
jgi:hypothetical protein